MLVESFLISFKSLNILGLLRIPVTNACAVDADALPASSTSKSLEVTPIPFLAPTSTDRHLQIYIRTSDAIEKSWLPPSTETVTQRSRSRFYPFYNWEHSTDSSKTCPYKKRYSHWTEYYVSPSAPQDRFALRIVVTSI